MVAKRKFAELKVAMRTPRLVLSPLDRRHAPALFELLNDWDVVKMLSDVPWPLRYEDVEFFLASEHKETEDFVILDASGPIGVMGMKKPGSGEPPRQMPRLGYWIGRRHWGQGYGTEAVGALVDSRLFDAIPPTGSAPACSTRTPPRSACCRSSASLRAG